MPWLVVGILALCAILGLICIRGACRSLTQGTRSQQIGALVLLAVGVGLIWFGAAGLYRVLKVQPPAPGSGEAVGGGGLVAPPAPSR